MLRAIELAETINALTCQINLLRDDEALKGKQGRLRAPAQLQTDRQTGGLSVREGERDVVQSNAPRRSTHSLTCQKKLPRDDAAGMARGNDDRGEVVSVGARRWRRGHVVCAPASLASSNSVRLFSDPSVEG